MTLSHLITIAGLLFVASVSAVVYVWNYGVGRDAGPPESMILIAGAIGVLISLILFGIAFGRFNPNISAEEIAAKVLKALGGSDAAEGARKSFDPREAGFTLADCGCREDKCESRTDGTCHHPTLEAAAPKPAPDAVREALQKKVGGYIDAIKLGASKEGVTRSLMRDIEALSAPMPSPDGAGEKRVKLSLVIEALESAANDARKNNISGFDALTGIAILLKRDPPSATGAAEPVAWRTKNDFGQWSFSENPLWDTSEPLYATPPVGGDREALLWAADVAAKGAKQCSDGDSEWHEGFRYAAENTALGIEADLRRAAAALPVQPGAGERGSDAAEADRFFDLASEFGNQLQTLAGVVQDAVDILAERKHGNAAISPGHNARVILEAALKSVSPSALPAAPASTAGEVESG